MTESFDLGGSNFIILNNLLISFLKKNVQLHTKFVPFWRLV